MLNPLHPTDTLASAIGAAPSIRGNSGALCDALMKLSGADMHELARNIPFETAHVAALIRETLNAVLVLQALREQSEVPDGSD